MNIRTYSAPGGDISTLGRRRRLAILATCCLSLFIVGIDVSAVNVALPSISSDLGATPSQLQWVIDAYTLVLASLLMLGGSLGDRLGRKRIFQVGLTVFGIGSILCSLSISPEMLIGARMIQAVGGSMLNPVAMSIITNTFTDPKERARAIGMWGAAIGVSMAVGPLVGGALVDGVGWEAIFWLNVPVCLAAFVLTAILIPESKAPRARRFDPLGQVLILVFLATLTFGIIEGRTLGWTSGVVIGVFVMAAISVVALVVVENRRVEPLLDMRFFRSVPFSSSVISAIVAFSAMGGFLLLNTLYLQQGRGFTPFEAGLMTLPMAVANGVFAPVSGRLVAERGSRTPMVISGVAVVVSGLMLTQISNDTSLWYLGFAYLALGVGMGMINAPITNAAVSGMPRDQAGVASAIASTSRQVGISLGVAVFGALAFARLGDGGESQLASASAPVWLVMAICGVVLLVLAFVATGPWAARTVTATRERITTPAAPS
ncbi:MULTISPECIES: MFS transporter [unclassified Gordonia (in: high G+C Gram-positive bacteria)]|uniref:MFS transporter n=1 Tax=unclassified Gordonia (in: high G+C Gram-positive bacteria) TaxID=2657482 RepID=UPI001F0FCAF6|nr:MFS transporter [Gordonia sp. ABSL49_1]MCH5642811.1 MFS transporter [Gordonia sp. ABSL49_1]